MSTTIKLGFAALSMMALVGCGAQTNDGDLNASQDVDSAKEDSASKKKHPEFYKCATDSDCVAIEQAGCCPHGYLVAVNGKEVKAYEDKYACTSPQICAHFVVQDNRVAECDQTKHQCQMIDPTQIRCGGFIGPALSHACPAGYQCSYDGHLPDAPGECVVTPSTTTAN